MPYSFIVATHGMTPIRDRLVFPAQPGPNGQVHAMGKEAAQQCAGKAQTPRTEQLAV